jgi:PAS domain S-box-containing protein
MVFWSFAHTFLQQQWTQLWGWGIGLLGLALAISLNMGLLYLPPPIYSWSNGWFSGANIAFAICGVLWAFFTILTFVMALIPLNRTDNPAHKNRIQYLIISILLLAAGYGMYLSLRQPFWSIGLVIACLGSILTTYLVTVENLADLGTGARYIVRNSFMILISIAVYVAGIYLANIFINDFLDTTLSNNFLNPALMVAIVTAIILTIVYTPVRRISAKLANRLFLGQGYDSQTVIQNYTQTVSNILYLNELSTAVLAQLDQAPGVNKGALFIVDSETETQFNLRSVLPKGSNGLPRGIVLTKRTPITTRLVRERQQLPQYTIDVSPQFKSVPQNEVETLKAMRFERFIPILKTEKLVGILAVGPKKSGNAYSGQDVSLLSTLADQTALALENAALFDRLQRNLAQTTRIKNLMDSVFDSIDSGVITTDISGKITFVNRAAELILHLPAQDCLGTSYTQALPALASTVLPNLIQNVTQRESRYNDYEIVSSLPQRGLVNLSMNLAPLKDAQNHTQGVAIVMDDLTETKRLRAVQDMFRCYVSPAVVDRLPDDPSELKLGGNRQLITVLFADIRGFTAFSEELPPDELVDVLNQYLSMAAASILMYEGTLDKFMGDAVMGIFNAPLSQPDHALRAVRAAAAMQRAIHDYHQSIGEERGLTFGVGLHMGEAVVGNVGMSDRMDYTAIGDTVNVAKRIQENSPGGTILMSEAVYKATKDSVNAIFYQELQAKGRQQPIATYELRM